MQYGISILLSGISLGGQYALIAIGYTMVYGILRLINFAHGDVFMAAGLIMVYLSASLPIGVACQLHAVGGVVAADVSDHGQLALGFAHHGFRTVLRSSTCW